MWPHKNYSSFYCNGVGWGRVICLFSHLVHSKSWFYLVCTNNKLFQNLKEDKIMRLYQKKKKSICYSVKGNNWLKKDSKNHQFDSSLIYMGFTNKYWNISVDIFLSAFLILRANLKSSIIWQFILVIFDSLNFKLQWLASYLKIMFKL